MTMGHRRAQQGRLHFSGDSAVPVGWAPLRSGWVVLCSSSVALWRVVIHALPRPLADLFCGAGLLPYWVGGALCPKTQESKTLIIQPDGKGPAGCPPLLVSSFTPLSGLSSLIGQVCSEVGLRQRLCWATSPGLETIGSLRMKNRSEVGIRYCVLEFFRRVVSSRYSKLESFAVCSSKGDAGKLLRGR